MWTLGTLFCLLHPLQAESIFFLPHELPMDSLDLVLLLRGQLMQ